jgi:hypothetical protein
MGSVLGLRAAFLVTYSSNENRIYVPATFTVGNAAISEAMEFLVGERQIALCH